MGLADPMPLCPPIVASAPVRSPPATVSVRSQAVTHRREVVQQLPRLALRACVRAARAMGRGSGL